MAYPVPNAFSTEVLNLAPCIVIGWDDGLDSASHLCQRALQSSPVCRALGSRVRFAATIKVIPQDRRCVVT